MDDTDIPDELDVQAAMSSLVQELTESKNDAVNARSAIEARWIEDKRQYNNEPRELPPDKRDQSTNDKFVRPPNRNITRSRTNIAKARIIDMVFPNHEQPWSMTATPDPDVDPSIMVTPDGQPIPEDQWPEEIAARAQKMSTVIKDQLTETKFSAKGRLAIADMCELGTGVLKGPILKATIKSTFKAEMVPDANGVLTELVSMVKKEVTRPELEHVDLWKIYPGDSADCIDTCERMFELHLDSKTELVKRKAQGFDYDAIKEIVASEPERDPCIDGWDRRYNALGFTENLGRKYAVWEFHGLLKKEELLAIGLPADAVDCELVRAEIWFCQGRLLKASLGQVMEDDRLPYFFITYERIDDTMFGVGVPFLLRDTQREISALYQAAQLNSSVSSNFLTFLRPDSLEPADKEWRIRSPKTFYVTDNSRSLNDIAQTYELPNVTDKLLGFMAQVEGFGDQEINLPAIAQGGESENVQTSSGLALRMNAANIVQRNIAMMLDDQLIIPVVTRYNLWNHVHNPRKDIRGDYDIKANGTNQLVRDIEAQHLMAFKTYIDNDPDLRRAFKADAWLRKLARVIDMPIDDMLRTPDEVAKMKAENPPPEDPMLTIEKMKIESAEKVAAQVAATKEAELDARVLVAEINAHAVEVQTAAKNENSLAIAEMKSRSADLQARTQGFLGQSSIRMQAHKLVMDRDLKVAEMKLKTDPSNESGEGI